MPVVCGIRFRGVGKVYYFSARDDLELETDDPVIVETGRGLEMGRVVFPHLDVPKSEIVGELKPVIRKPSTDELLDAVRYEHKEQAAVATCRERVEQLGLPMKIVGAEYSYDGSRLTFFFAAEQRVDFRDLVRDLARTFRTRIDLRQIGVRDEAKIIGGIGKCGRPLCCSTWLTGFSPISIRMAKNQDLPLSPSEISGQCGRLLCCLRYEDDHYRTVKKRFPKEGRTVETELGPARVVRIDVLQEEAQVRLQDGTHLSLTAGQLRGEEPITAAVGNGLADEQRRALESALKDRPTPSSGKSPQTSAPTEAPSRGESSTAKGSDERQQGTSRRRPRRRSRRRQPRRPKSKS
ncbi:MAG: PSP1 domain-containing protein [Anaerolineae bacterium]